MRSGVIHFAFLIALLSGNTCSQAQDAAARKAAVDLNNRGLRLLESGQAQAAEPVLKDALRLSERGFGANHKNTGVIAQSVGSSLYRQSKSAEAIPYLQRSIRIAEAAGDQVNAGQALDSLGLCQFDLKDYSAAAETFRKSLPLQMKTRGRIWDGRTRLNLGRSLVKVGKFAEAVDHLDQAYSILKDFPDAIREGQTAMASHELAVALEEMGEHERSEEWFRTALKVRESVWGTDSFGYNVTLQNLGRVLQRRGEFDEAADCCRRAWQFFQHSREAGPGDSQTLSAASTLCDALISLRRFSEAEELLTKETADLSGKKLSDDQHIALGAALRRKSILQLETGHPAEAAETITESLEVLKKPPAVPMLS
ncbi:MAG: tetratricopeptide repeat protein [Planctomycetaceae bacterium]